MIDAILQKLVDEQVTSAKEISELTGVASSTVYRWISGKCQPDFNAIRLLLKHLPHQRGQEAILSAFVAGTGWQHFHVEARLDLNFDGQIDRHDAMTASIDSVRAAGESLAHLRKTLDELEENPDQTLEVITMLRDVIRHCTTVEQILVTMTKPNQ